MAHKKCPGYQPTVLSVQRCLLLRKHLSCFPPLDATTYHTHALSILKQDDMKYFGSTDFIALLKGMFRDETSSFEKEFVQYIGTN